MKNTQDKCVEKYGDPLWNIKKFENNNMTKFRIDKDLTKVIPCLPAFIYCNIDLLKPLECAFSNILSKGLGKEIVSYDGCYNPRYIRDSSNAVRTPSQLSMHAFGLALDFNANTNPLGSAGTTFSKAFIACFTDCGFTWGGNFLHRLDPMHFEYSPFLKNESINN